MNAPGPIPCPDCTRRHAPHGTDGGYYHENRHGQVACDACLAAHAEATNERRRKSGRKRRGGSGRQYRLCPDCGTRISADATRCKPCYGAARSAREAEAPTFVLTRGGIWRAA